MFSTLKDRGCTLYYGKLFTEKEPGCIKVEEKLLLHIPVFEKVATFIY